MKMIRPELQRRIDPREQVSAVQKAVPAVPHATARRANNLAVLVGESATRFASTTAASGAAFAMAPSARTWAEWASLQAAVAQRFGRLQQSWLQGCSLWLEEFSDLRRADTLSEFTEQQYNLVARLGELAREQTSALLSLQENIQVDFGWWAARKLQDQG